MSLQKLDRDNRRKELEEYEANPDLPMPSMFKSLVERARIVWPLHFDRRAAPQRMTDQDKACGPQRLTRECND